MPNVSHNASLSMQHSEKSICVFVRRERERCNSIKLWLLYHHCMIGARRAMIDGRGPRRCTVPGVGGLMQCGILSVLAPSYDADGKSLDES